MNDKQFWSMMDDTWSTLRAISNTKGQEYAHSTDRLANFKRLAAELELTPEKVLWVYWTKHKDSIVSYINELSSAAIRDRRILSEPIEGRIDDAILYLILLKGLLRERNRVPEGGDAQVRVARVDDRGLQPSGERNPGFVAGYDGYRILGRDQVVRADDPRLGDSLLPTKLLHETAGGLAEACGESDGEAGRGGPASGDAR